MHGHSFHVEIAVAGEIDPHMGWLIDYAEITDAVEPLLKRELDHRCLNDVPGLENPTSEMVCVWLWERLAPRLRGLTRITLAETCAARCTYHGA
jgi:6-pyruvoyltetrahydropterin/6-carboxytetrahydropterin synthase